MRTVWICETCANFEGCDIEKLVANEELALAWLRERHALGGTPGQRVSAPGKNEWKEVGDIEGTAGAVWQFAGGKSGDLTRVYQMDVEYPPDDGVLRLPGLSEVEKDQSLIKKMAESADYFTIVKREPPREP